MRLLHVADLHLDRAFAGMAFAGCDGAGRRDLLREALEWSVDVALEGHADALTIGGDLFEVEHVTSDTAAFIARQLGRLRCPVVLAAGNHDPATPASPYHTREWPENVTLALDPEPVRVATADAVIWALGYRGREIDPGTLRGFRVPEDDRAQLLLVHGVDLSRMGSDRPLGGLGLEAAEVRAMGFDHVLLGHIHAGQTGEVMSWPGSTVPLDPSETSGNHGALWVEAVPGRVTVRPVPSPIAGFLTVSFEVDEIADSSELAHKLHACVAALPHPERTMVTARLVGRRTAGLAIDGRGLESTVCDVVLGVRVVDASDPEIDLAELAREPNARGRAVARMLEDGGEPALQAANLVVEAFEGDIKVPV